jgi:hypothetical protein
MKCRSKNEHWNATRLITYTDRVENLKRSPSGVYLASDVGV